MWEPVWQNCELMEVTTGECCISCYERREGSRLHVFITLIGTLFPQMSPVRVLPVLFPNSQHCPPSLICVNKCLVSQLHLLPRLWPRQTPIMVARPPEPPESCMLMVSVATRTWLYNITVAPAQHHPLFSSQGTPIPGMC